MGWQFYDRDIPTSCRNTGNYIFFAIRVVIERRRGRQKRAKEVEKVMRFTGSINLTIQG
jgi:hypothetical protein